MSEPLRGLVRACETFCDAKCCGDNAFDITAENVGGWVSEVGLETAARALEQIEVELRAVRAFDGTVCSGWDDFNMAWPAPDAATFLEAWRAQLVAAIASAK